MLWGPIGSRDASCAHSPAESAAKHTAQGVGLWKCELLARCSHFLQGYFMIALTFTQVDDDKVIVFTSHNPMLRCHVWLCLCSMWNVEIGPS